MSSVINKRVTSIITVFLKSMLCLWCIIGHIPTLTIPKEKEEEAMIKEMYDKMSESERKEFDKLVQDYTEILSKPEGIEQFNSMLEDMNKAIDQMGGLEAIEKMSDKEMDDFFAKVVTENTAKEKEKTEKAIIAPTQPTKSVPKPKLAPVDTSTLSGKELLLENIQSIIKSIDSFFIKVSSLPELPDKMERWAQSNIITTWGYNPSWNMIRKHIELLHNKLVTVISIDKKTGARRYFDHIYENEALRAALQQLKVQLSQNEPFIDTDIFGFTKFGEQSKKATQKVVDSLGALINEFKINEAINSAIEKYEPIAKEMREAEEKFAAFAAQESKKRPPMARSTPTKKAGYAQKTRAAQSPTLSSAIPTYGTGTTGYMPSHTPSRRDYRFPSYEEEQQRGRRGRKMQESGERENIKEAQESKKEEKKTPTEQEIKAKNLLRRLDDELRHIEDTATQKSVIAKMKETIVSHGLPTPLPTQVQQALKEMTDSIDIARDAASSLYDNATDPSVHAVHVARSARPVDAIIEGIKKIYPLDTLDAKIDAAKRVAHDFYVKLHDANKALAASQENLKALQAQGANTLAAQNEVTQKQQDKTDADAAYAAESKKVQEAYDLKQQSVHAEALNLIDEHNKLQRQISRFSRKSRS